VQPYTLSQTSPRDAYLAILSKLDNTDKHKVILVTVNSIEGNVHGNPRGYRGSNPEPQYEFGALREGARVATFRCSEPSPDVNVPNFKLLPSVSLSDIGSVGDTVDAGQLLWRLREQVKATVEAFQPF
jgi:hypothetical protein